VLAEPVPKVDVIGVVAPPNKLALLLPKVEAIGAFAFPKPIFCCGGGACPPLKIKCILIYYFDDPSY
jgi:hypothetical protein